MKRFNDWLAVQITNGVGTMWTAYFFTLLSLVSLPAALKTGNPIVIVGWIAQTFLQLVLLPIIIVGQRVQDAKHEATQEKLDDLHDKHDRLHDHLGVPDA